MKRKFFSPANDRLENENSQLDKDGFPPCTMTLDQFVEHLRETFGEREFRIVAFKVRAYCRGGTVTTRRGEMNGLRANKLQVAACEKAWGA